jgi:hypothetical protein
MHDAVFGTARSTLVLDRSWSYHVACGAAALNRRSGIRRMSANDQSGGEVGDVWDRARRDLAEAASYPAEAEALKAQLTAHVAELSALEAQGAVPRGVRRRGERLLEEVSALLARPKPVPTAEGGSHKGHKSKRKPRQGARADRQDVPPEPNRPTRPPGRSQRGRD